MQLGCLHLICVEVVEHDLVLLSVSYEGSFNRLRNSCRCGVVMASAPLSAPWHPVPFLAEMFAPPPHRDVVHGLSAVHIPSVGPSKSSGYTEASSYVKLINACIVLGMLLGR